MKSQYSCVYGISSATPDIQIAKSHRIYVLGKKCRIYWFLYISLYKRYWVPNISRFDKEKPNSHINVYHGIYAAAGVRLATIFYLPEHHLLLSYSTWKAGYGHWTWNIFACLEGSIYKAWLTLLVGLISRWTRHQPPFVAPSAISLVSNVPSTQVTFPWAPHAQWPWSRNRKALGRN